MRLTPCPACGEAAFDLHLTPTGLCAECAPITARSTSSTLVHTSDTLDDYKAPEGCTCGICRVLDDVLTTPELVFGTTTCDCGSTHEEPNEPTIWERYEHFEV